MILDFFFCHPLNYTLTLKTKYSALRENEKRNQKKKALKKRDSIKKLH